MARKKPAGKKPATGLSEAEQIYVAAMIERHNYTRAYQLASPGCSAESAASIGWRWFRKVKVREAIETGRRERLEQLKMDGTEAMRRVALIARADVRRMFRDDGTLLPVNEWPDELALAVKSVRDKPWGREITFDSRLGALQLVAEADGTLKKSMDPSDMLTLLLGHATAADVAKAKGAR